MRLEDYIVKDFTPFTLETPLSEVKAAAETFPFSHFPIIDAGKLIGLLRKDDLIHVSDAVRSLKDLKTLLLHFHITDFDNHFDLINLFAQYDSNLLPVTDKTNTYIGFFELSEILQVCNNTPFFQQNSTTLVIEKEHNSYSMSEIAQIIETNEVKLLGMYISQKDSLHTQITLRLDTENPNEVIQSLRRYEYHVLTNSKDDFLLEQLKERSDYLQKYLEF